MRSILLVLVLLTVGLLLLVPGATLFYEAGGGRGCTRCHEMNEAFDLWANSTHREVPCTTCHGGAFTPELEFHWRNLTRVVAHVRDRVPQRILLGHIDVVKMVDRCRSCHQQEFAQWTAGPHSATYARIFAHREHNEKRLLMDDCLRCHGMHFEGGIRDLVTPVNRQGPWQIIVPDLAEKPSIPCLACHSAHRHGSQLRKVGEEGRVPGPQQEITRPSLAFFDRRTQRHIPVADLPLPAMLEGERPVRMSPDPRQALCYQCHAPDATRQVGSGDDRTPIGVHEGISCLACHKKHGQKTRASCAECHPKMSNCGLDVETMDTTFRSPESKNNIHWVKCSDCHPRGIPPRKTPARTASLVGENRIKALRSFPR